MLTKLRLLAGVFMLSALVAWAAEPPRPAPPALREPYPPAAEGERTVRETGSTAVRAGNLDEFMTSCLRKGNQGEITLAKIALKKTSNSQVKDFAELMIKEHTEFLAKLDRGATGARTEASRTDNGAAAGDKMAQFKQIGNELHEQCLNTAVRELEQKDGAEFDKCFVGMQIAAHMKMVDELTVFKRHASPELSSTITEGLQKSQEHLEHAKKLIKHLDALPAASTARQSEDIRK